MTALLLDWPVWPDTERALGWPDLLLFAGLLAICVVIVVVDARQRIIPDACNLLLAALGLGFAAHDGPATALSAVVQGLIVFALFWAFRALYRAWRGHHGLGLGDVKFLGAAGLWVGIGAVAPLILVACVAAFAFIGLKRWRGEAVTARLALPFGPFLVVGFLVMLVATFG